MKYADDIEFPDLDALLASEGGLEKVYKKLLKYAARLLGSARKIYPEVTYFHTLDAEDIVQYAICRLLREGSSGKPPYHALRNFVDNRIRADKESPRAKKHVFPPIGGTEQEWNDFFTLRSSEELDPSKQTIRDEVDAACSQFVEDLKEEFAEDPEVLDILFAMECGIYSRKEITAQMKISHPIYDKAIKRLQRRAASRKGEFINATR